MIMKNFTLQLKTHLNISDDTKGYDHNQVDRIKRSDHHTSKKINAIFKTIKLI